MNGNGNLANFIKSWLDELTDARYPSSCPEGMDDNACQSFLNSLNEAKNKEKKENTVRAEYLAETLRNKIFEDPDFRNSLRETIENDEQLRAWLLSLFFNGDMLDELGSALFNSNVFTAELNKFIRYVVGEINNGG